MSDTCHKTHADYNYFNCERVHDWHIIFSIILLILTLIVGVLVLLNSIVVYKYREFNLVRFRFPMSIIAWGILTEIYLISRIIYSGILFKWWSFSIELDTFNYTIRSLGLNGGILIYLIRAWMYYVTYKYDLDVLNNRISTNKSWLFSNKKYSKTIANEKWLLKISIVILILLTTILAICRTFDSSFFSNVYYGMSFILTLCILVLVFRFAHDQLGIRIEYVSFFFVYIFGFIGTLIITSMLKDDDTSRRVLSWFGGLVLLFAGNTFTFYFPFIRGGLLKVIRNNGKHTNNYVLKNHKELALILSNQRTFEAFRIFLASIFCCENIDFFVSVGQYRYYQTNSNAYENKQHNRENTATAMLEKVLNINIQSDATAIPSIQPNDSNKIKHIFNDLKRQKNANDMIENLIVINSDGRRIVNPKNLHFEYLELNNKLKSLDINKWANYIYNQYISDQSDHVINISYNQRLIIQKHFEPDKYSLNSNIAINAHNVEIFDEAQNEIWKLMVNDSLTHFKHTQTYKQLRSFFQTVEITN